MGGSVEALLFNSHHCLDFSDIRHNVLRIPEVIENLKEAQQIWDQVCAVEIDLINFVASDNDTYLDSIHLKKVLAAVVQLGLWERHIKRVGLPKFILGTLNGDSGVSLVVGECTVRQLILDFVTPQQASVQDDALPVSMIPRLTGEGLKTYALYQLTSEGTYIPIVSQEMNLQSILQKLIQDHQVDQLTNIGPGQSMLGEFQQELALLDVYITESIDSDPMLNWFWPMMKTQSMQTKPMFAQ